MMTAPGWQDVVAGALSFAALGWLVWRRRRAARARAGAAACASCPGCPPVRGAGPVVPPVADAPLLSISEPAHPDR